MACICKSFELNCLLFSDATLNGRRRTVKLFGTSLKKQLDESGQDIPEIVVSCAKYIAKYGKWKLVPKAYGITSLLYADKVCFWYQGSKQLLIITLEERFFSWSIRRHIRLCFTLCISCMSFIWKNWHSFIHSINLFFCFMFPTTKYFRCDVYIAISWLPKTFSKISPQWRSVIILIAVHWFCHLLTLIWSSSISSVIEI